jgi:hypothetical protein
MSEISLMMSSGIISRTLCDKVSDKYPSPAFRSIYSFAVTVALPQPIIIFQGDGDGIDFGSG